MVVPVVLPRLVLVETTVLVLNRIGPPVSRRVHLRLTRDRLAKLLTLLIFVFINDGFVCVFLRRRVLLETRQVIAEHVEEAVLLKCLVKQRLWHVRARLRLRHHGTQRSLARCQYAAPTQRQVEFELGRCWDALVGEVLQLGRVEPRRHPVSSGRHSTNVLA